MNKLVGIHNISARKLRFAQSIGGLPCPSIAYVNPDIPMQKFGEVTLVADKPLANPAQGRLNVFDADIYSSRFPNLYWDLDPTALANILKPVQLVANRLGNPVSMETLFADVVSRKGVEDITSPTDAMLELQLCFLEQEMGQDYSEDHLPRLPANLKSLAAGNEALQRYLRTAAPLTVDRNAVSPELQSLCESAFNALIDDLAEATAEDSSPETIANEQAYWQEKMTSDYFAPNGNLSLKGLEQLCKDQPLIRGDQTPVDRKTLRESVSEQLRQRSVNDALYQWTEATFQPAVKRVYFNEPYGNSGRVKHTDADLKNIVRFMNRQTRNGEDFMYGAGSIRAQLASGVGSWGRLVENSDRIVSEEKFREFEKQSQQQILDLCDLLRPRYRFSQERFGPETLAQTLVDSGSAGAHWTQDFDGLEDEHIEAVDHYLESLRTAPTTYFEGKFRRSVSLDEFSAALVPEKLYDQDPELVSRLESAGVAIKIYRNDGHYKALMKSLGAEYGVDGNARLNPPKRASSPAP